MSFKTILTIAIPVVLAFVAYFNSVRLEKRKNRLERLNRQLDELYGPLLAIVQSNQKAWDSFLEKHDGDRDFYKKEKNPTPEQVAEFHNWMKTVFMPNNEKLHRIIVKNTSLLIEDKMPKELLDLFAHIMEFRINIKARKDEYSEVAESNSKYKGQELLNYCKGNYRALKTEQIRLIGKRWKRKLEKKASSSGPRWWHVNKANAKMIYHFYYFSATGNTQKSVQIITDQLKEKGHDVHTLRLNRDSKPLPGEPDRLMIAFPAMAWCPPVLVQRFMRRLPRGERKDGTRIKAAVFTADGGGCLQAPAQMKRMLERRKYDVFLTGRASYPDNWLQVVSGPGDEKKERAISEGQKMTGEFARQLVEEEHFHYEVKWFHRLWSRIVGALFAVLGRRFMGKMFIADSSCTSCRLCERSCPVGAIVMKRGKKAKPYWKFNCESCNRCINICPEKAIVSSNVRILFLVAGISAALTAGFALYGSWVKPWLASIVQEPFLWIVNVLSGILIVIAAHWIMIGPFDAFVLRYVQKLPGWRRIFEKGFNKGFRRYTMTGFEAPKEDLEKTK